MVRLTKEVEEGLNELRETDGVMAGLSLAKLADFMLRACLILRKSGTNQPTLKPGDFLTPRSGSSTQIKTP